MIIKGGSRSNGGFFARHLTNDYDEKTGNDRAELRDMRGVTADTVDGFFREVAAVASGTRCKNFFYHASMSPELTDQMTVAQRLEAVDMLEKNLGLTGQPRFVMEHEKAGRIHQHVIWSRIDPTTMKARDDSLTYRIHERTSREIEERFDLVRGRSTLDPDREGPRPERRPPDWEGFRASQKATIDPALMKVEFTELWQTTDSGKAFAAAIEDRGYVLARGDQRGYVVLDHAGDVHSLARCIDGVKTAGVRERMADVPLASLPSVADAREHQRAPFTRDGRFDRAAAVQAWQDRGNALGMQPEQTWSDPSTAAREKPAVDPARDLGRENARSEPRQSPPREASSGRAENVAGRAGFKVLDGMTQVGGKLADFVADLLSFGATETKAAPTNAHPHLEQLERMERAEQALENIRDSIERGGGINAQDLRNLTPEHKQGIASGGDDYLRWLIQRDDEGRTPDIGRERER
jgi:hypothetical protein